MGPSKEQRTLSGYERALVRVFRAAQSRHEGTGKGGRILVELAGNPACLGAAPEREIRKPGALNTRHFPSVGLTVCETPYFVLIVNCFLPAPNGETDLVASAVHHHGHLLL